MKIEFDYKQGEWIQLKSYLFPYLNKSELVQDFFENIQKVQELENKK